MFQLMKGIIMQLGSNNDEKNKITLQENAAGQLCPAAFSGAFMPSESQSDEHLHKRNHQPHNRCNKRTQNPGQHQQ